MDLEMTDIHSPLANFRVEGHLSILQIKGVKEGKIYRVSGSALF
tara:strand:+ start:239 stop:370 length:132 start_codon:yes stop_codon:yes gene_type:complete